MAKNPLGRNGPCPCKSGRKFKNCCAADKSLFRPLVPALGVPRIVSGDGAEASPIAPRFARQARGRDDHPVSRIPVHYTYAEPFGEAECVYCFPVDRAIMLIDGHVILAGWLASGMKIRMEDGGPALVTGVEPHQVWEPPSHVSDQQGNCTRRVLGTIKHKGFVLIDVKFGGRIVTTTPDHLFWSTSRGAWVPVGSMWPGELLCDSQGDVAAVEVVGPPRYGFIELYNLEVEELHTFFVGGDGGSALVHNGRGSYIKQPAQPTRQVEVQNLKPMATSGHSTPRPGLQKLSDDELLDAARKPKNQDYLTESSRTGTLVDGNGRALELQRRAADPNSKIQPDTLVPVETYTPDMSMFPDLD